MPSSFRTPLDARLIGPDTWQLLAPFEYRIGSLHSPLVVTVPRGFKTDLTSIPRGLRWLLSPAGAYAKAAVLHDWLYRVGLCSRLVADAMLVEGMMALGVPRLTRAAIYFGVRAGGWWTWRRYRRREALERAAGAGA